MVLSIADDGVVESTYMTTTVFEKVEKRGEKQKWRIDFGTLSHTSETSCGSRYMEKLLSCRGVYILK